MLKRAIYTFFLLVGCISILTASDSAPYRTRPWKEEIKTLRMRYWNDAHLIRPILELEGDDVLEFSFDELSHDTRQYSYTVVHCNADWTESDLMSSEYLEGFTTADITDYLLSENTKQIYTHYTLIFPNDDMRPKISGNYAVKVYEDGDPTNMVCTFCFSVVEPWVHIQPTVRYNTQIELSGRYQQLDIDVETSGYYIQNAADITLVVQQNNRWDNLVYNPRPNYIDATRLRYIDNRALIFEGGNEFRSFDIESEYVLGMGVDRVSFDKRYYHALLFPSENLAKDAQYLSQFDVNGQFVIHSERAEDADVEADYMWVHFMLPAASPWLDGGLYVSGDLTYNLFSPLNRMQYNAEDQLYFISLYLKQGGYNFQYLFVPMGEQTGTTFRTEGSFWQTRNEYDIYVYHRPFGGRYDKLIGYKKITENE